MHGGDECLGLKWIKIGPKESHIVENQTGKGPRSIEDIKWKYFDNAVACMLYQINNTIHRNFAQHLLLVVV